MKKFVELVKEINLASKNVKDVSKTNNADSYNYAVMNLKILENNAKIALYYESIPVILEILNKYNGKSLGPKTTAKIKDEVFKSVNCRFYFDSSNNIVITPCDWYYRITVGLKSRNRSFLQNNKLDISGISIDNTILCYINDEYVEDIQGRIEELIELKNEAIKLQRSLESVCSKYNHLSVDGIANIEYHHYIY